MLDRTPRSRTVLPMMGSTPDDRSSQLSFHPTRPRMGECELLNHPINSTAAWVGTAFAACPWGCSYPTTLVPSRLRYGTTWLADAKHARWGLGSAPCRSPPLRMCYDRRIHRCGIATPRSISTDQRILTDRFATTLRAWVWSIR